MNVLCVDLVLEEPLLATGTEGDANTNTSLPYAPGSLLRGALVGWYLRDKPTGYQLGADADGQRLFLDGRTRYLGAYPLDSAGRRWLPTPLSFRVKKGERVTVYDFAAAEPEAGAEYDPVREAFCFLDAGRIRLHTPLFDVSFHHTRDRDLGHPVDGGIYRHVALAEGGQQRAYILCEADDDAKQLRRLMQQDETLKLGGDRNAGYGQCRIAEVHLHDTAKARFWRPITGEDGAPTALEDMPAGPLVVTLLSPALVRDAYGQYAASADAVEASIARGLGLEAGALRRRDAFFRPVLVGGFNAHWGMALPQMWGVAMGSVFVFDAPALRTDQLRALEWQGIGHRRAEGYGRLCVNWHGTQVAHTRKEDDHDTLFPVRAAAIGDGELPGDTHSPVGKMAQRMVQQILRDRMDRALRNLAARHRFGSREVRGAQRGHLRAVLQDGLLRLQSKQPADEVRVRVVGYIESLGGGSRSDAWRRAKVEEGSRTHPALNWMRARVQETPAASPGFGTVAHAMKRALAEEGGLHLGDIPAEGSEALVLEYNLRLLLSLPGLREPATDDA